MSNSSPQPGLQSVHQNTVTSAGAQVLVVDDDLELRELTASFLRAHGFIVHTAADAISARNKLNNSPIDVLILDVMMPGEDGLSLARSLVHRRDLAIIMVSALGHETDRIVGLELGADDYLAKPISPRELIARIRAVLRRRGQHSPVEVTRQLYRFADWQYDVSRRVLLDPDNVEISLSHGEYDLLQIFLDHPQRILTRDQLLDFSKSDAEEVFDRAIDSKVSRLRRKLASRTEQELVRTIRNEGYFFVPKVLRL